jgi:plastocyanin
MRQTVQRSHWLLVGMALVWLCPLVLCACGSSSGQRPGNEVDMGVAEFQESSITIRAGQSVQFVDPANGGGVHVICIGKDSMCVPQVGAPAQLNVSAGIQVSPGDSPINVTFTTKGTYVVVCTIHPGMAVTINVD